MFNNVMWATDGSENADQALGCAVQIAQRENAHLHVAHVAHVAHVVEKLVTGRVAGQNVRLDEPELEAKIEAQTATAANQGI